MKYLLHFNDVNPLSYLSTCNLSALQHSYAVIDNCHLSVPLT